ncbi:MAG TPA: tyrosinase family protein, partial [Thermoanaerobaculia bacterium]
MTRPRALGLLLLFACTLTLAAQPSALRTRPRIDDPNEAQNTALYVRAVQILKARDADPAHRDDPNDPTKNGYKWFAELHNGDEFAPEAFCRHGNELFLPWHRALLVLFEQALQQTAPPDTLALRLPYWNWTDDPTFPAVFQSGAPLFFPGRTPGAHGRTFTTDELRQTIRSTTNWSGFGGGGCSAPPSCTDGSCVSCTSRFGALESPAHNQMHNWVGGQMLNDTTAGDDYIFWSFHTYIDLLYDCWQQTWDSYENGCPNCPLNQLPGWTPARVLRASDLGYTYDFRKTPCSPAAAPATVAMKPMAAAEAVMSKPLFVDVTIPPKTFTTAHIRLAGIENLPDYNYSGRVYLFPQSVAFAPEDAAFRERYFVGDFAVWGNAGNAHAAHGGSEVTADVDATTELAYLAKKHAGKAWRVGVAVAPPNKQTDGNS